MKRKKRNSRCASSWTNTKRPAGNRPGFRHLAGAGLLAAIATLALTAANPAPLPDAQDAGKALVERGRYITHDVAMCIQCHTPRNAAGELLMDQMFTGAPIPVARPSWARTWAPKSANIAGLTGYTDDQIVDLLTTGMIPDRQPPQSPMPPFRMTKDDARAVIAYLRSIPVK